MWEVLKWVIIISYPLGIIISCIGISIGIMLNKKSLTIPFIWGGISICLLSWVMIIMLVILIQSGFIIN